MTPTDALQLIALISHIGLLALLVAAWLPATRDERLFLLALAVYVVHATAFYIVVVIAPGWVDGNVRMLWGVVLRLHSVIVIGAYLLAFAAVRQHQGRG